jgi:excisionase family DNA binding protein
MSATKPQPAGASLQLLTVVQVADEMAVTTHTVRNWIKKGVLPAVKFGGRYRIQRRYLEAVLDPFAELPGRPALAPSAPEDRSVPASSPWSSVTRPDTRDPVPGAAS